MLGFKKNIKIIISTLTFVSKERLYRPKYLKSRKIINIINLWFINKMVGLYLDISMNNT